MSYALHLLLTCLFLPAILGSVMWVILPISISVNLSVPVIRFILHMTDEDVDDRRAETQTRSEYQEKVLCPFDGNEASSFDIWAKRSHYVRLMSQTDFLVPTCEGPMTVLTES